MRLRQDWQKREKFSGEIEDFDDDVVVGFEMRKGEKRKPAEIGEDMVLVDKKTKVTGVFDGLGGEGKGDKASAYAAERFPALFEGVQERIKQETAADRAARIDAFMRGQASLEHPSMKEKALEMQQVMWEKAPREVQDVMLTFFEATRALDEEVAKTGGKTTVTIGRSVRVGDKVYEVVANVGDSGVMKVREDGSARSLIEEDSMLRRLVIEGLMTPEQARDPKYIFSFAGQKMTIPDLRRKMDQAVGMYHVEDERVRRATPRITAHEIRPGESVVYMTDGLRDEMETEGEFDPAEAAQVMQSARSAKENAIALNDRAARGKKYDDKAVIVKERFQSAEVSSEGDDVVEIDAADVLEDAA